MKNVDLERFWRDDEVAHRENCFYKDAPQVALGIRMSGECVFAELGEEGDPWGHTPRERRIELNKRYNDKAEKIVGKRLLPEKMRPQDAQFPRPRRIGEVFGGHYESGHKTGQWLESPIDTPQELEKMLDRVDSLDLREFMLPDNWDAEKTRIYESYGKRPGLLRGVRGPVTLAMSIYGVEKLIFLYMDNLDLFRRFSKTIGDVIIGMGKVMDHEAGYEEGEAPGRFRFMDDNCCMLTPEMYREFGYPVLERVFATFAPNPEDNRFQHSDSDMGHLLPLLADFNLTGCNFGPTVMADDIREHMPRTRIDGCLAPFTFMNNDTDQILAEVKRDCEAIKRTGTKGLNLSTAGSINNGSSLESMRTVMRGIVEFGQYGT